MSALPHRLQASDGQAIDNVIHTDQPIDAGNAGGPLLDAGGQVIGINSEVITRRTVTAAGRRWRSPSRSIPPARSSPGAAHAGPVRVAYIGLGGGSARAAHAGGDGDPVASLSDVLNLVTTRSPGQSLALTLRRRHRLRTVTVVLGSRTATPTPDAH